MSLLVDKSVGHSPCIAMLSFRHRKLSHCAMHFSELTRCSALGSFCRNYCKGSLARKHATASSSASLPWPSSSRIVRTTSKPQKSAIPAAAMAFRSAPSMPCLFSSVADTISNCYPPTMTFGPHRSMSSSVFGPPVMALPLNPQRPLQSDGARGSIAPPSSGGSTCPVSLLCAAVAPGLPHWR